ncbi:MULTISPECIES: thiamine pyrophosphate-binding protein [unclassified Streptomyces]|uniref:thiamine pyrophosphate-binding protein n=1 Tax=unclassified Streptomyces TaxID=2593676 RepID=UPI00225918B5|nr:MULTISPECIES: thiamine pyrophosphate-binding protein [unclassified Streptomyces]MCX5143869.1 thiamine pyrophosphate-binding protein [Streptomyces sp. NBC_00338]WRZ68284.1 thiamine pyrophosphate-binding protein [Streptomyces sp. NBC_01257]WSU62233.1 thiamine pyrophosphate-binding protein [Streptomyces sp. NBC_01104]
MTNGAELLVNALIRNGVDTIFGYPGDTSIAFYDVLGRRTDEIRHVLARDERHAGFMADSYTRTTRRLGVCEASSGAGAVYLASGLAEAFASSIPVLVITTDNNRRSMGTAPISEVDQEQLFAACTKWRRSAGSTDEIPALVEEAVAAATSGRPGPVALILPEDVLEGPAAHTADALDGPAPHGSTVPGVRPAAPADAAEEAAALLAAAERPVIVAGGGAHLSGAGGELVRLAEHAAVPVATSIHGKGVIDESHPLALGVVGGNGARPYANAWVAQSDAVVFVGTRANATDTLGFTVPDRDGPARIVHIESDTERAGRNYPGSTALVGDARTVIEQLRTRLPRAAGAVRADRDAQLAAAREVWARQEEERRPGLRPGVLDPREIVRALRDAFGRDTWVVADAGTPTPYLSCHWEAPGDGWRVVIPRGHGPMGFAVPASIGTAIGHPGERVLCLTTENSIAMAVGEWETAVRLALPVTYVVLDNTSMAWIKMIQHLYAGGRYFAVDPGPLDPVTLGLGMGIEGSRAHTQEEFAALAKLAADSAGPSLIHAMVPEHTEVLPPVPVWQAAIADGSATRPIH